MAKMVKAIRMILGMEYFSSAVKLPPKDELDIEIEDEVPERKPSLEELDPLEVSNFLFQYHFLIIVMAASVDLILLVTAVGSFQSIQETVHKTSTWSRSSMLLC